MNRIIAIISALLIVLTASARVFAQQPVEAPPPQGVEAQVDDSRSFSEAEIHAGRWAAAGGASVGLTLGTASSIATLMVSDTYYAMAMLGMPFLGTFVGTFLAVGPVAGWGTAAWAGAAATVGVAVSSTVSVLALSSVGVGGEFAVVAAMGATVGAGAVAASLTTDFLMGME